MTWGSVATVERAYVSTGRLGRVVHADQGEAAGRGGRRPARAGRGPRGPCRRCATVESAAGRRRRARPPGSGPSCAGSRRPRPRRSGSSALEGDVRPAHGAHGRLHGAPRRGERGEVVAAQVESRPPPRTRLLVERPGNVAGKAPALRELHRTGVEHVAVELRDRAPAGVEPARRHGPPSSTRTSAGSRPLRARASSAGSHRHAAARRRRPGPGRGRRRRSAPRRPRPLAPPPAKRARAASSSPCTVRPAARPLGLPAAEVGPVVGQGDAVEAHAARGQRDRRASPASPASSPPRTAGSVGGA